MAHLAARAEGAPDSASVWEDCLRQSLGAYGAVRARGVRQFTLDLAHGRLQIPS